MKELNWYGLYSDSWQGEIVPEAFSHPAKYSRALIRKIYQHMLESGWIKPGDKVVDPFGGVALGAYHAMQNGLVWCGCELEPKFVDLGNQNITLWNGRYAPHFTKWGAAVLVQGDSRNLAANVAGGMSAAFSSPPYASDTVHGRNGIDLEKTQRPGKNSQAALMDSYGDSGSNLGHMKEGDFAAAVSSSPYADAVKNGDGTGVRHDPNGHKGDNAYKASSQAAYGKSNGQLGQMNGSGFEAAVSSSPFEKTGGDDKRVHGGLIDPLLRNRGLSPINRIYSEDNSNIGNDTGETFWMAARQIVEQTYQILKPGAYTAWVCGDFIRNKKRVYFGRQWMELCQAIGFEPIEWAVAWKREPGPIQTGMFGSVDKTIDRVSFFRRLANEKNPDNAILNEDILFMQKPL